MTHPVQFFKLSFLPYLVFVFLSLSLCLVKPVNANEHEVVAEINGVKIDSKMLSILSSSREHGPLSGMDESQDELLENLIATELLFQAAEKKKLQEDEYIALELELAHKTLLSQFYVMNYMEQLQFDEATLRSVYDKKTPSIMLRMAYWTFPNQIEAQAFLNKSLTSKTKNAVLVGEELPWQALENLPFAEHKDAASLKSGQWLNSLTQEGNLWFAWYCLEDSTIPKPSFEEVRDAIQQELATESLHEHIADLRKQAKVVKYKMVQP